MAKKKSFKSLPKKAQKAAFAQMDDDGTRRGAKKASAKAAKNPLAQTVRASGNKLKHARTDSDKVLLSQTQKAFAGSAKNKELRETQLQGFSFGVDASKRALRGERSKFVSDGDLKQKALQTLRVSRAFKIKNKLK